MLCQLRSPSSRLPTHSTVRSPVDHWTQDEARRRVDMYMRWLHDVSDAATRLVESGSGGLHSDHDRERCCWRWQERLRISAWNLHHDERIFLEASDIARCI